MASHMFIHHPYRQTKQQQQQLIVMLTISWEMNRLRQTSKVHTRFSAHCTLYNVIASVLYIYYILYTIGDEMVHVVASRCNQLNDKKNENHRLEHIHKYKCTKCTCFCLSTALVESEDFFPVNTRGISLSHLYIYFASHVVSTHNSSIKRIDKRDIKYYSVRCLFISLTFVYSISICIASSRCHQVEHIFVFVF